MTTAPAELTGLIQAELPTAITIRHDLHAHPELGYHETRTAERIASRLSELGVEHVTGLARGTGVLAHLPATDDAAGAPTVALRADIDALPIAEATGLPYASTNDGRMHACGHDGHTANLLAVAAVLSKLERRPNNVTLLFQPAEEGGAGADAMIADGALNGTRLGKAVDVIYGLHGWPEMPLGMIGVKDGPLLAATDEFTITIAGVGGHAAFPHNCVDPVVVASQIVTAAQHLVSRRVRPTDSAVITIGSIHAGSAPNVIPQEAVMRGTMRTLAAETREQLEAEFRRLVTGVAESMNAHADIDWHRGYPVTHNDGGATDAVRTAVRDSLGDDALVEIPEPFMGGEDFSFYSQHARSSFFVLGLKPANVDSYPALHTPTFDFNDDALAIGADLFVRLATADVPA